VGLYLAGGAKSRGGDYVPFELSGGGEAKGGGVKQREDDNFLTQGRDY